MVIYDKNQFSFNLIFVFILLVSLASNYILWKNAGQIRDSVDSLNTTLAKVEENQNFNFIQGSHVPVSYKLTEASFEVMADDYGELSGPSMQPAMYDGNTLIETKYDGVSPLYEGMVIRFLRRDGTGVIHRIRADYGDRLYVQGDSLKEGEIIQKSQVTHIIVGVLFT
ncbi:MAG: hypothetical protein HGA85_00900 [Nanoarchaeota archaeon]|nr:hypothetical protein [Nanoarchaeota archaeon]